jgi:hypothetical protein
MNRLRLFALLATAILPACSALPSGGSALDGVRYEADRTAYTSADSVTTVLRNESDRDVGYNLCVATLEKRMGGGWIAVQRNPEHPCTMPLYALRPGETATFREPASRYPGDGVYRLRTRIETPISGRALDVVTGAFEVRAPRAL